MDAKALKWDAFILFDPTTRQCVGIYASARGAEEDRPNWQTEGYTLSPCEITLVKRKRGRPKST